AADLISSKPLSITAAGVLVLENNGTAATINSNNNNISVVANDVQLFGTINSGTGALSISSGAGLGMDLGEQIAAGFGLDNAEFAKLTSAHLVLGQPAIADVFINSPLTVSGDLTINAGNINFNQPISTTGISATGNVLLNAQASIVDNAGIDLDIVASNISLHAQSGIGNTNPLEIQLANATGILDFSNLAGSVDIINTAVSASDVMQVFGTNLGAGDALTIGNDFGVTDIIASGVTSNQGLLEIVTDTLNVNALLDNNNSSMPMKLLVNDLEITADLFSTTGGVKIGTLSDGTGITFAGGVTTGLDLTQSEIDFINAPSIDFGIKDMPLAGMGTGDIIFAAGINFGASDVSFLTMADLRFLQGALTAITTSGNVFIDTAGSVIGQSIDVTDISATNLDFITALDFGNTLSNAIELDVALLAGSTPGGEIYIDSPAALLVGFINSASGLPVWMQANGDITLATLTTSGSNISLNTSALTNGVGGAILHDGVAANNINGANDLNLLSETGVGSLQNAIEITNVTGNISADVMSVGNIYLDNVGAASGSLLLDSMTTLAGDVLIRNLNTAQSTNIMTQLLATGNITVESNSDINVNNNVIASGGSVVDLRVVGGTGDVNINSLLQADNGSVAVLTNSGGISFGTGGYISSNAGVVSLNASGSISDGGALGAHLRGADSVMLNAALGIGTLAAPITVEDIGVGGLTLSSTLSNGIYVNNVAASLISDFVINSVTAANGEVFINNLNAAQGTKISGSSLLSGGNFSVSSIASMFIDGSITDSSAGIIDLQVNGAGGSLFINSGSIQSSTGTISLLAANDIQLSGATILQTAQPGLISLTANNGQVFSDPAVSITGGASLAVLANTGIILNGSNDVGAVSFSTAAGDIDFSGSNDILLDVISASTTSSVTLTAAGSIIDANGATDNITAQTISLNAANGIGTLTDPIETAAAVSLLFNNAANDVFINDSNAVLLLPSVSGGNANISFVNNMQLNTVVAAGNLSLISQAGYIQDSNDSGLVTLNLTAASIDLSASTGIGLGNPIETQLTASTGVINAVNSSSGSVEIENWAINSTDVATFTANNLALGGAVFLLNPFGVMQAGNISANQGAIELKALDLNISGTVNNNDLATGNGVLLVADELLISGGSVNANNGDVEIFTLTDGRAITLGAADLSGNSLALLQSDMDAITSARLSIGLMDSVNSLGSGDITIAGVLDVGAKDIRLQTLANINFNNGTVSGLSTSGLMELNAGLAIIGDNSSGINLTAAGLSLEASHGIGSVDAIRTQVSDLTVFNQFSNNINVSNSGALTVNDSANLGGAMSLSSDNSLTLTPFAGLAGTTGAIAQTDLTLKAANSLLINGVTSAANINLLSDNGIIINEVVTATAGLVMNADADANAAGDLLIENINAAVLAVNAADISVNAAAVNLLASSGAVHVSSEAGLNLLARTNVNIAGGDGAGFDAYLSASGNINMDITGNLLLNGGTGSNTAASIFDVSASHSNILNMAVAGNVTLNGGPGVSSGAYISAGEVNMLVGGDMTLSGSPANFSPAQVRGFGLDMSLHVAGNLSFSDGTGSASLAQVISNDGLGYLQLSYLSCSGCATGLLYLDQPIPNAATNEIVSAQNTSVISTGPVVSSSDALLAFLEESLAGADSNQQAGTILTTTAEDEAGAQDKEPQAKVLVCR
ncbi:MAG: hypothetical protein OEY29_09915, partial [Gammaproteobacteria bacterium]|nr:hypothetical protein [Gammaproteobacteria bacterium]